MYISLRFLEGSDLLSTCSNPSGGENSIFRTQLNKCEHQKLTLVVVVDEG